MSRHHLAHKGRFSLTSNQDIAELRFDSKQRRREAGSCNFSTGSCKYPTELWLLKFFLSLNFFKIRFYPQIWHFSNKHVPTKFSDSFPTSQKFRCAIPPSLLPMPMPVKLMNSDNYILNTTPYSAHALSLPDKRSECNKMFLS